jgi:hypothetical protein
LALNYVTLILDLYDGAGNPIMLGNAILAPNAQLADLTDNLLITPAPITVTFGTTAPGVSPQARLLATDNANLAPSGWAWTLSFIGVPGSPASITFYLPFANGATQYLSSLVPLNPVPALLSYLPLPTGTPQAGQVPVATGVGEATAWGAGGGGGAVSSVFTRTGAVTAQSGDYSVGQVTGAAPLASPAFTGTPTAPTAAPLTNSTQAATTAYADAAVAVETARATTAEGLAALKANNLSDLASAVTARANLGLGTAAVAAIDTTAADFQPIGPAAAGATGKVADAGHAHPYQPWQFPVEASGAKGDGKVITDAVMTSGSANIAATTSLPFTSTGVDGNKYILVSGAGGGTYSPKMFQISTVTNSGHAVLNANASSNTGGTPGAIAYFGTDDTAAIQSAINAAVTYAQAHNGYAEVLFSDKIYIIAGAFQVGGVTLGNFQLGLPIVVPGSAQQVVLMFKGATETTPLMHWVGTNPMATGSILASVRTDGTNNGTYGPASVIGGPINGYGGEPGTFSNALIKVRGLGMLLPYNATMSGLDLFGMLMADVDTFACFTAAVVPTSSAPSPSLSTPGNISNQYTFGLRMPDTGNQVVCRVGQFSTEGLCYGFCPSEWTYAEDIHCMYCIVAIAPWAGGVTMVHSALIVHAQCENCTNALTLNGTGTARIDILDLQTEVISSSALIFDPSSQLQGTIHLRAQGSAGNYTANNWLSGGGSGGTLLRIINEMTTPGPISSPQAPPSTGAAWLNGYSRDAWITLSLSGGTMTVLSIDAVDQIIPTGCVLWTFLLPAGHSYTPTYGGTLSHNVTLI